MRIDHQTLADLEIMEASDGGPGLFDLIDRTTTSFGRAALRRRFKRPLVDPAEIRATQEVVRWLRENPGHLRVSGPAMDAVDRYLRSNVVVSSASRVGMRLEQVWMSLRYRDLLREMGLASGFPANFSRPPDRLPQGSPPSIPHPCSHPW
jgi:hypothetical protein